MVFVYISLYWGSTLLTVQESHCWPEGSVKTICTVVPATVGEKVEISMWQTSKTVLLTQNMLCWLMFNCYRLAIGPISSTCSGSNSHTVASAGIQISDGDVCICVCLGSIQPVTLTHAHVIQEWGGSQLHLLHLWPSLKPWPSHPSIYRLQYQHRGRAGKMKLIMCIDIHEHWVDVWRSDTFWKNCKEVSVLPITNMHCRTTERSTSDSLGNISWV